MDKIQAYSDLNPDKEVLALQTFACHGIINKGSQRVLINQPNSSGNYYEVIHVETNIRKRAIKMPKVYFLILFACCREGYTRKGENQKQIKIQQSVVEVANFTMIFGCDPASGVPANT